MNIGLKEAGFALALTAGTTVLSGVLPEGIALGQGVEPTPRPQSPAYGLMAGENGRYVEPASVNRITATPAPRPTAQPTPTGVILGQQPECPTTSRGINSLLGGEERLRGIDTWVQDPATLTWTLTYIYGGRSYNTQVSTGMTIDGQYQGYTVTIHRGTTFSCYPNADPFNGRLGR